MSNSTQHSNSSHKRGFGASPFSSTHPLVWLIGGSTLILFICSSVRHFLLFSTAFDLGIFDQALYLLSQDLPPIPSIRGIHILGDHAAWIFYPLALLYKVYPDVHWLFLIQALGLSLAALPLWALVRQAGLNHRAAVTLVLTYLLYPLVFNVNLFDFHPEVLAPVALLGAVLAARANRIGWFSLAIVFVLSLKAVLALSVAAMGFWLLVFEQKRVCGAIALIAGMGWFLIAAEWIIPAFSGKEAAAVGRYDDLGGSPLQIAQNLVLHPAILLTKLFTLANLQYVGLLVLPVLWGLSPHHLAPLIGAFPIVFLNLVTDYTGQKDLVHQYSVAVMPFLMLAVLSAMAANAGWLRRQRWIVAWSLIAFLSLAKYGKLVSYFSETDSLWATREAIAAIQTQDGVLTDNQLAPQVSHRPVVQLLKPKILKTSLADVRYVLLNLDHPWSGTAELAKRAVRQLQTNPEFELSYHRDRVFLFVKKGVG
ncbi:DUF2079 domain-containing protein [Oculatella sp. LEGE 06141]|uniref:DUF2079 domain-containing protein n=1 Tax=Oculatella sp. LEGE 06141 TaxID=1828648 RepID=UPI0018809235|nr:DUF2079 domain-containing protein [Oculatella sp. LEGE 06141]MBE9182833.1 DUF2079 domain-containing protein [Oculatella sp. LEGE 06141]